MIVVYLLRRQWIAGKRRGLSLKTWRQRVIIGPERLNEKVFDFCPHSPLPRRDLMRFLTMLKLTSAIVVLASCLATCLSPSLTAAEKIEMTAWRFTTEQPADGWQKPDFDDSSWKSGEGGFGTRNTPGARLGTVWNSNDIWIRKSFDVGEIPAQPGLLMHHDEDVEVYINGTEVVSLSGWSQDYVITPIDAKFKSTLKRGENVMAAHCRQTSGGQYIDIHFVDADNPATMPKLKPFETDLITEWGAEVTAENAWTEYPRPQMSREDWKNLNGNWDYAITPIEQVEVPSEWNGTILVPFPLESKLGGVQELLAADECSGITAHLRPQNREPIER